MRYNPLHHQDQSKIREKIQRLSQYLEETHGVKLYRAISISEAKLDKCLSGDEVIPRYVLNRISDYFCIPLEFLIDDSKELPDLSTLTLDEDLLSIQRHDTQLDMNKILIKKYFSRNWRVLGHKTRIKLIISILAICIPLITYIVICCASVLKEKEDVVNEYRHGSDESTIFNQYDPQQVEYHGLLQTTDKQNNPDSIYCNVVVGAVLEKIKNINSAGSSFETRMQLYFAFDKDEFKRMFTVYAKNVLLDQIIDQYYVEYPDQLRPYDIDFDQWLAEHEEYFTRWVANNDARFYPGETPSNVLVEKETMFGIGNGEFVADSYGTVKGLEEFQYRDEAGNLRTLCYQKVMFNGLYEKAFDSIRYPLDSVRFVMYILPTMDAQYLRYIPDRSENSLGERISGFTPFFGITNGYRLINEDEQIKNLTLRIHYLKTINNDPAIKYEHSYRTQLEIIVRATRHGLSLFLQAFMNLFSVVIWILIAFYYQSYAGEDSIGMLGTGLFGVISSILVGLSLVSDAGLFSIITMINIYTLAVIMTMTYQSISAKRASIKKDYVQIAYNGIKLRILFVILTFCTIAMFGVLPLLSYIWTF